MIGLGIYLVGIVVTAITFTKALGSFGDSENADYWTAYGLSLVWPLAWLAVLVVLGMAMRGSKNAREIHEKLDAMIAEAEEEERNNDQPAS